MPAPIVPKLRKVERAEGTEGDSERAESDRERAESDRERAESDSERAESDSERAESDSEHASAQRVVFMRADYGFTLFLSQRTQNVPLVLWIVIASIFCLSIHFLPAISFFTLYLYL